MSDRFEWVPDLARGEWLRPMESESFNSIFWVVPRGFEAYARVFHPVERDRPRKTQTWQGVDAATSFGGIDDIGAALERQSVTWAKAAASFGATMHAEAQYAQLLQREEGDANQAIAADGWRYAAPSEGSLDGETLSALSGVLAGHTTTPDAGIAAIWEGWGGLVSSHGFSYLAFESTHPRTARATDKAVAHIAARLVRERLAVAAEHGIGAVRSMRAALTGPTRAEPGSGAGLLAHEVAAGPRFELHANTGRSYILFAAGANDLADASWPRRAPWVDEVSWAKSPSILWPEDHSWVLATEIDYDSTLVGGTEALIRELVQAPGLEVLPIRTDAAI